jgi:hypothetical protein
VEREDYSAAEAVRAQVRNLPRCIADSTQICAVAARALMGVAMPADL